MPRHFTRKNEQAIADSEKSCTFATPNLWSMRGKDTIWIKLSVLTGILFCQFSVSPAQETTGDSIDVDTGKFRVTQLIAPTALIAVGSFGVSNGWLCSVKQDVREGFQDLRGDRRFRADDYLLYLPAVANLGLGWTGAKARHPFRERLAATATAYATMNILVQATKHLVKERRPDSEERNSFPSGHTATAFMGAELVREEYGNAYGTGAYIFATGIAFLRLYNNRHWLNDVVAGAGFGILSARIGYWLLPLEKKLFGWNKSSSSLAILPTYFPETRTLGLEISAQL